MMSTSNSGRWLVEVTAVAAPADPTVFEEQRQLLCPVVQFDPVSRTWWTRIGALDVRALDVRQRLYETARCFGTEVQVQAVAAPDTWSGSCFTEAGELANIAAAHADRSRLLGQLPLA